MDVRRYGLRLKINDCGLIPSYSPFYRFTIFFYRYCNSLEMGYSPLNLQPFAAYRIVAAAMMVLLEQALMIVYTSQVIAK